MKKYKLKLPQKLKSKSKEICEYLLVKHYYDGILSSGACAYLLNIDKYYFQGKTINQYNGK